MAGSNRKKKRTPKTSKGINGQSHHPLGEVAKALLGKGLVQKLRHVPTEKNWSGTFVVREPFDPEEAAIYAAEEKKRRNGE
jgi:hypothetical protein